MAKRNGWIDIMASGHVFVRGNGAPRSGTLPCFNAGSHKDAQDLVVFSCVLSYDRLPNGQGIYAVPGFRLNDLDAIYEARERFQKHADELAARRREREASRERTS
jgi:hypothetical protein